MDIQYEILCNTGFHGIWLGLSVDAAGNYYRSSDPARTPLDPAAEFPGIAFQWEYGTANPGHYFPVNPSKDVVDTNSDVAMMALCQV